MEDSKTKLERMISQLNKAVLDAYRLGSIFHLRLDLKGMTFKESLCVDEKYEIKVYDNMVDSLLSYAFEQANKIKVYDGPIK